MLQAPERNHHGGRLRELLTRFRAQQHSLLSALELAQTLLEHWQRETSYLRVAEVGDVEPQRRLCIGLREECDTLELELAHVRMAILGVGEELALHEHGPGSQQLQEAAGTWLLPA